ncbi:MAG: ParA family protein [Syntrophomonadaceae bacterium]|nr:ParA family protein [Syntrophomonadaceae bacterium]
MATTIVLANRKGGSGKTTTALNLADGLARTGQRVLLVDADSQAQATSGCGILPYNLDMSIYELLHLVVQHRLSADAVHQTLIRTKQFDLLPSKPDLSALELEASQISNRESLLHMLLMDLDAEYDYIVIDLPPSLGLITINGLVTAQWLLVPIELTFFSMDGLAQMMGILYRINAELNTSLRLMGILPVKCDLRTNLARNVIEEVRQNFGESRILPAVRNDIKLAEAPSFGKSIFEYAPHCRGALDYQQVTKAILARSEQ